MSSYNLEMSPTCTICQDDATDQLQCTRCKYPQHYTCALGFDPPEEFKSSDTKSQFICPTCIVGSSYDLIHLALDAHRRLHTVHNSTSRVSGGDHTVHNVMSPIAGDTAHNHQEDTQSHTVAVSHTDSHVVDAASSGDGVTHGDAGSTNPRDRDTTVPSHPPNHIKVPVLRLRDGPPHSHSESESGTFRPVLPESESRRVKRCKGMLHGLKHIPTSVDTLLILDSNGRSIKAEEIDGSGDKICVRGIGGLCVSATTTALKELKVKFPKIKSLAFGLGTNDHLHARQHPGNKVEYIKALNTVARKVFPGAKIHFILPFSAINGLSDEFVDSLGQAIRAAGVGWKVLTTPTMRGKLTPPSNIHLNPSGRKIFTNWLQKVFAPRRPATTSVQRVRVSNTSPPSNVNSLRPSNVAEPNNVNGDQVNRPYNRQAPNVPDEAGYGSKHALEYAMLKERLFELMMVQPTFRSPVNRSSWVY